MDELTTGFLHRLIRLRGRMLAAMAAGCLALGGITPANDRVDLSALLSLLAAWMVVGWAVRERENGMMRAVLSAPTARRPWMVAHLIAASLAAAMVSFTMLLTSGFRPALIGGVMALAYGWMIAAVGLWLMLRMDRPRESVWIGGVVLALLISLIPSDGAFSGSHWGWHPFMLYQYGVVQALQLRELSGSAGSAGAGTFWNLPMHGVMLLVLLSLFAWRWMLRALDRLEALPAGQ